VRPEFEDYYFQQLIHDGRYEGMTHYRLDPENLWYPAPPETVEQSLNNMVYTLNWIKQIAVTFRDENGNLIKQMYIDDGTALADNPGVPDPEKEGYDLLWAANGETYDANTPITSNGAMVMSATYVEKPVVQTWTVTFDSNGGSAVKAKQVVDGETVAQPEEPVQEGFKFIEWTLDDEKYDFRTPVTSNITLVASWEEIPYVVGKYQLLLDNSFAINYYIDNLREGTDPADYTVSFGGGEEQPLTSMVRNEFLGIGRFAAAQMTDSVSVVVKYQGNVVFTDEASVRGYCDKVFNFYGEDSVDVQLVGICRAALDYGSEAQLYFNYNTDNLANGGVFYNDVGSVAPAYPVLTGSANGITGAKSTVSMGSSISQNFRAQHAKKVKLADYTFRINGQVIDNSEITDTGKEYRMVIPEIFINSINLVNTMTVTYKEGTADEQILSYSISPIGYLYDVSKNYSGETSGNLAFYLYNYYVSTTTKDIL
jgi:hypothetical protein